MKREIFIITLLLFIYVANAQEFKNPLITVGEERITSEEFINMYKKNLSLVKGEDEIDIDEYLQTFINYKLKVAEARRQGFHQKDSYKTELAGYRAQLLKNYMTDVQATDTLLKEAYARHGKEINVSHILVRLLPGALPQDTIAAYQKALELRKKANASNFDSLLSSVSNGIDVIGEKLGYFSVFKMVYPFEDVAFKTPVGTVSQPFRTSFGYHFLKVNDLRTNRGGVQVAHIMITNKDSLTGDDAEQRIQKIYNRLKNGASFEELAKQFSEDKGSAIKEGRLPKFSSGTLNSGIFEEKAFGVSPGELTEPFKTRFGWHIIKGINKYPIGSFEEEKAQLKALLERDMRSKILSDSFIEKLKNKYNFKVNTEVRNALLEWVGDNFYEQKENGDKTNVLLNKPLFSIKDTVWQAGTFVSWLSQAEFKVKPGLKENNRSGLFNEFCKDALLKYHEQHLEFENADFAGILNEYREGLLLYEIMQEEVWDAATKDSLGLRKFYDSNKKQYGWKKRVKLMIASYASPEITDNLKSLMEKENNIDTLTKLTSKMELFKNVIFSSEVMELDDYRLPDDYKPSDEWFLEKTDSAVRLIKTIEIIKPDAKTFEESRGAVMNDYQDYLEQQWIEKLRNSYRISVDKKQFKKLKRTLSTK